jgi:hypothetical protein
VCVKRRSNQTWFARALLIWATSTSYDHRREMPFAAKVFKATGLPVQAVSDGETDPPALESFSDNDNSSIDSYATP